jgi:hypothetical protein
LTDEPPPRPRTTILIAIGVVFVVSQLIPFGGVVLYPLTLFTTWVHEMGHGLTALALGGDFRELQIFGNAGGFARFSLEPEGWKHALVAAGGLLAPPIVGSALLAFVHGPRRARVVLAILAAALVLSIIVYVRSAVGVVAMAAVAALLGWAAWRGFAQNPHRRVVLVQVLGVLLALDTLTRMVSYAFMGKVVVDGEQHASDISKVADGFGGHYLLWGLLIVIVAVGLLALSLWWAWRRPAPQTVAAKIARSAR